jgi:hypothetical protein
MPVKFWLKIIFALVFFSGFTLQTAYGSQWTLDLNGGFSSPMPGGQLTTIICQKIASDQCLGAHISVMHTESSAKKAKWTEQNLSLLYEKLIPLVDEYHFVFMQIAGGMTHVVRTSNDSEANASSSYSKWCPQVNFNVGAELPMADLIGLRFGINSAFPFLEKSVSHFGVFVGIRMGLEWIGIN